MAGIRIANEIFQDKSSKTKFYSGFRLMYGLHRYATVALTAGVSNHHLKEIPRNYIFYLLNHHARFFPDYPVTVEGLHGSLKLRLLSLDGYKSHWRIAALLEASQSFNAHDEAEANLMTDNSGYGLQLIATRLYHRWAINVQTGAQYPRAYRQQESNTAADVYIRYSDTYMVMVSNGFRLYPGIIKHPDQTNINIYAELMYKQFQDPYVENSGKKVDFRVYKDADPYLYGSMSGNAYLDLRTYLQFIVNAQSRLELGAVFSLYSRSYLHNYPMVVIQWQRFVFGRK
jgi:hypothetical protein